MDLCLATIVNSLVLSTVLNEHCWVLRTSFTSACPKGTYSCDEGAKCVLLNSLCDKTPDCQDQSDERNCPLLSNSK